MGSNPSWEVTTGARTSDRPTERFAGPIGLDGVYRKDPPTRYGIDAVKGSWIGRDEFAIERRILGHGETQLWTLTFDGKQVDVHLETTDGFKADAHGETAD